MSNIKAIIDSLQNNDKVFLVYCDNEEAPFEGYVHSVDDGKLTLHEYVPNIYRTFNRNEILEIVKM